jgi:dehydrogenase/reductase SDR family member 1
VTSPASQRRLPRSTGSAARIAARCEHTDDGQVEAVFRRVRAEQGRPDVLVNNAMSTPQRDDLPTGARSRRDLHPFWEMPVRF